MGYNPTHRHRCASCRLSLKLFGALLGSSLLGKHTSDNLYSHLVLKSEPRTKVWTHAKPGISGSTSVSGAVEDSLEKNLWRFDEWGTSFLFESPDWLADILTAW
jgi:hypothetical protein